MDPRYKLVLFPGEEEEIAAKIKQDVLLAMDQRAENIVEPSQPAASILRATTPSHSRHSIDGALAEMLADSAQSSPATADLHPVDKYLTSPAVPMTSDPAKFWIEQRTMFPTIYTHALSLLSCPSTSVASERVFSITGRIIEKRRSRLTPDNVEMLSFIKFNMK